MEMESLWKNLPIEIIHLILKYTGKVIYRNNCYIDINKLKGNYSFLNEVYTKQSNFQFYPCRGLRVLAPLLQH